jgi:hypothetical protein
MTLIRTTCPRCGEVEMGADAIRLSVRHPSGDGRYRFKCPRCEEAVEKRADRDVVALLLSAGVEAGGRGEAFPETETLPGIETLSSPPARPFTPDDLLEFHFLLQDDERLARELSLR